MEIRQKIVGIRINTAGSLFDRAISISDSVKIISYVLISITIPMCLFLIFREYTLSKGMNIESGCHGPEFGFGMLSGVLMCIQLRFISPRVKN